MPTQLPVEVFPKLKSRLTEPPGGWVFRDMDTNTWLRSRNSLDDLIAVAQRHRAANKLPIPERFADFIEASICYRIPGDMVMGMPLDRKVSAKMADVFVVQKHTQDTLNKWRLSGGRLVLAEEADRRSKLCAECPKNVGHLACLSCQGYDAWVFGWIGSRKTRDHAKLQVCQVDLDILWGDVWMNMRFHDVEYPEGCWKKECHGN